MSTPSLLSAIQKLRHLLTREEKVKWLGIVAFALATSLLEILTTSIIVLFVQILTQPTISQKYLSKIGLSYDLSSRQAVVYAAIIMGFIYCIKTLTTIGEVIYQNFSIQRMNYRFTTKLMRRYAGIDYGTYLTRNSSLGLHVVGGEVHQLFSNGLIALVGIFSEGISLFFLMIFIISLQPALALIIVGIGSALFAGMAKIVLPLCYRFGQKEREAILQSAKNRTQFFHAFKEIVLLGKQEAFIDAAQAHYQKQTNSQAIQTILTTIPRPIIEILFVSLFITAIAFLCLEHENPSQMISILGGYLYVGFRLMPGFNRILSQLNLFKASIPAIERVYTEYTTVAAKQNYVDVPDFQFKESITFHNVYFKYLNTKKNTLSNLNLTIKKGECIGIIGTTGSGKSTLIDLILGLLRPSEGSIFVDGCYPVNSYQWHQKIGYVPQNIYLIDDTIEANIAFGEKEIDPTRLSEAIETAQLGQFVKDLPEGIKTIIGERGIRLSGGERQRIVIARALYHAPEVLIFDEATSALDHDTEERLIETIYQVSQHHTVLMIAHRVTTLKGCDRIVVIEKGHIKHLTDYDHLHKKNQKKVNKFNTFNPQPLTDKNEKL